MKAQILRLPIQVKLYNEGKMVKRYSVTKKTQARLKLIEVPRSEWDSGTCRVWYSKPKDNWNEFWFTDYDEFDSNLALDTEWDLLKGFITDGTIDPKYIGKRKVIMTDARRKELSDRMKLIRKRG